MKRFLLALLMLGACSMQSPADETLARAKQACTQLGLTPGSGDHINCVQQLNLAMNALRPGG